MNGELIDAPNRMPPVVYEPNEAAIAEVRQQFADLIADADCCKTPDGYERVKGALKVFTSMRTTVEKARQRLKADSLEYGRKVDAKAKQLTSLILDGEDPLRERKEAVDREAELAARKLVEEQMRKEEEERQRVIAERAAAERAEREREAAERRAERERLDAERRAWEAEQEKIREANRVEREKLEAQQAEIRRQAVEYEERQRAERLEREKELAALRAEREAAERRKFEEQAQADAERRIKEAAERAEKELTERVEREAAARAERLRLQALEDIRRQEKETADRIAAAEAMPDVQKIKTFGDALAAFADESKLTCKTPKAAAFVTQLDADLAAIILKCRSYKR